MANNSEKGPQGCPVDHESATKQSKSSSWSSWFSRSASAPPASQQPTAASPSEGGGCPVKHDSQTDGCPVKHNGSTPFQLPASIEEAAKHAQTPLADQRIPLSTQRVVSTIPRADELRQEQSAPHQPQEGERWVYPSEQQFYNAMRRKGWAGVDEATVPFVVRIHNAVNERGWGEVRKWEQEIHGNDNPRLVRFLGRPQDMSPRALINTWLFWYNPPFDRHDWYVDGRDGKEPRRYVIDFYNGSDGSTTGNGIVSNVVNYVTGKQEEQQQIVPQRAPSMYLDVRPALDTPEAVSSRLKMFLIDSFPGIYAAFGPRAPAIAPPPTTNTNANTAATEGKAQK